MEKLLRKNSDGKTLMEKLCLLFSFFPIFTYTKRLNLNIFMLDLLCHEKTRKMKKTFCFNNCSCYNLRKNLSSFDFSFSQVTSVEEREPRGTFLSLGLRPRLQKTFPRFPFFYFGNLGKTKIVRGQIFPQSSTTNYRNKILLFRYLFLTRLRQNLSTSDLTFSQVTEVEKREPRKSFLKPRP